MRHFTTVVISQLLSLFSFNTLYMTAVLQFCMCFYGCHTIKFVKLYFWLHIAVSDMFTRRLGSTFEVCGHLKYMKHLTLKLNTQLVPHYLDEEVSIRTWRYLEDSVRVSAYLIGREFTCCVLSRTYADVHTVYLLSLSVRYW